MDTKIDIRSLSHEELLSFTENLLIAFDKAMQRIAALEQEVERLKRDKNNNSGNSSKPPSTDQKGTKQSKSANEYNQRSKSGKAKGGQKGHVGNTLTKASVIEKIAKGELAHRVVDIGNPSSKNYISKYVLDLRVVAEAIEVRFHADANGHFSIPEGLRSDVVYGPEMKSLAVLLYGEGIMSTDRICTVLNSLSGGTLNLSGGSGYAFCQQFADCGEDSLSEIEALLKNADTLYTDGTCVSTNGEQTYIRNFSTDEAVLYKHMSKKNLENLSKIDLLKDYNGTLIHDHETALYNFGTAHGECNAHIARYLKKNTEETGNMWSQEMSEHLCAILAEKKERIRSGAASFSEEELEAISLHYDAIIAKGWQETEKTKGWLARKEERKLLRRLAKYKENHLLFAYDFRVEFTNNMSERDLRKVKGRQKMAGGFREASGAEMYCKILSVIETLKRRGRNILEGIKEIFMAKLVDLSPQPVMPLCCYG